MQVTRTSLLAVALVALAVGGAATAGATSNHLGIEASASDAEAGGTTTISVTLSNNGDSRAGAIVDVTSMPDGWEVQNHSDDGGTWNSGETKWLYQGVQAGSSVEPSVTLSIPDDASGEHEITVQGTGTNGMNVSATATVSLGGGEGGEETTDGEDGGGGTNGSGPGFGAGIAVLAVLGLALLALRRQ